MRRVLAIAAVATLVLSTSASAQRRATSTSSSADLPVELGMDAALVFGLGNNSYTAFTLPVSQVRAGFFISPELSIEPTGSLNYFSTTGFSNNTLGLGVGALYHFSPSRAANQVYVRPFIDFTRTSTSVTNAGTTTSNDSNDSDIGIGVGIKMPWIDRLAWRFEGNLTHSLSSGGGNQIGLLAGLSYFTK